jgi:DNA-binding SARP family transcriptional activator
MMMPFLRKSLARHVGRPLAREWLKRIEGFPSAQTLEAFGIVEEVVPRLPHLEIRAFGHEHVLLDGKRAPQTAWGGPLVRELFFYILDQGPVTLDEIGLVFWPDYSPAKVKSVFHSTMYRLRRLIPPEVVIYDDESAQYLFNRDHDYFYDVEEFEKASDMALREESSEEEIMRNGNKAIELYRGEFLGDSSLIWCLHRREKLRQTLVHVVMRLAALHREKGNLGQSIRLYHRAIEEDPFLERAHRGLMRCYALQGERSKAIKHYLDYLQYLMEELDMAPSDETMNLHNAILNRKFNKDQLKIIEP